MTRMRIVLCVLFLSLMTAAFGAANYARLCRLSAGVDGWNARMSEDRKAIITDVEPEGPATALRRGDEIVLLDGVSPRANPQILNAYLLRHRPGDAYQIAVRRDGREQVFTLRLAGRPLRFWLQGITQGLMAFLFLSIGVLVFALRPRDKQAFLLSLMLSSFVALIAFDGSGLPKGLQVLVFASARIAGSFVLPFFLHFFLIFPTRSPWLRRFPRLEALIYPIFLLFVYPGRVYLSLAQFGVSLPGAAWMDRQSWIRSLALVVAVGYLVSGLVALVVTYRSSDPVARRRARVAVIGSGAGFFTLSALFLGETLGLVARWPSVFGTLDFMQLFTLPLIPISFAYAIVRHKVIPISLIVRRGVRYLLVSRGSALLELVTVFVVVTVGLTYVFSRMHPPGMVVGIVSAVAGILTWKLTSGLHDAYLAPVIDRMFFRQSYDAQQILSDLGESLRATTSVEHLLAQVATRIQSALQTESVVFLLREEETGEYLRGYACVYDASKGIAVPVDAPYRLPRFAASLAALRDTGRPLDVEPPSEPPSPADLEARALREMGAALLLPLTGKDGMPAILSLGPRLGDLPYSGEDRRLLMSVVGPTTFALENARLVERMIEEARRREEIEAENEARAKELEEARQLQISMLPRAVPALPHVEIAAYMKTATEVGGDYYDFHVSDDGTLTVVVGDATGHGLKAGTVVTATKSLFNHLAPSASIPEIFQSSSRALKQMNLRSLFMAMMMVKLRGARATLSSAGMPALLLYRAGEDRVEDILICAMPLGSLTNYRYTERSLDLQTGDVLLLMSDGFPERFNPAREMIPEQTAAEILHANAAAPATTIVERLVAAGDAWADGAPQNDDITFVVLKLRSPSA